MRELFSERSPTYVELGSDVYAPASIRPLPKSNELIWYSERSCWAHLYLYNLATGKLIRPLTSGKWLVLEVGTDGLFNHVDRDLGPPGLEQEIQGRGAVAFWSRVGGQPWGAGAWRPRM